MVCIAKYPPQIIKYHEEYKMYCIQYHINYPKNKVAFGVWGGYTLKIRNSFVTRNFVRKGGPYK